MKKYLKKWFSIVAVITMVATCIINVDAYSTSYKTINKKTKVGNYYIWSKYDKGIYVSKSKKSSGTRIVKAPSSHMYIGDNLVTNGDKIYYSISTNKGNKKDYMKIYRINVNGKDKAEIVKISTGDCLKGYYDGKLLISRDNYSKNLGYPTLDTYSYNLKKKKLSLVKKDFTITYQTGQYFLGAYRAHEYYPVPIHLYDAKNNKLYKITSTGQEDTSKILNGKVYYADIKRQGLKGNKVYIKNCSYTGKKQKTLCTIKLKVGEGYIESIESSYVKYVIIGKNITHYKCYYSSGKIVKVIK